MSETAQVKTVTMTLDKLPSLSFTEPVSFRFSRCQAQAVESWRELYGGVLKQLCQKNPEVVRTALPEDETGDLKASKKMKNPFWVRRGIYAETGLNTDTIIRRIKQVMDDCGLSYSDLKITYFVNEARKQAYEERIERERSEAKVLQLRWDYTGTYKGSRAVSFRYKNHRTKQVRSWADLYYQFISYLADEYPKVVKDGVSFGDTRTDICKAGKKKNMMQHPVPIGHNLFLETFGTSAMLIGRMYNALMMCKLEPSVLVINFVFKDPEDAIAYTGKSSKITKGAESEEIANLDERLIRRLRFLLNKHFEDGYRLESTIDRNRLHSYYEAQYREQLPVSDEELQAVLQIIASPVGGRIMPKKQASIDNLMKTIMGTVSDTFASGATCIYTSELLKLYQNDLSQIGIHDEQSLEELVMRYSGNNYRTQYSRICYGRRKADVGSELVAFLREAGSPVPLEDLINRFWYVPAIVLERELYNAEEVVLPSARTYFSAMNLPIKNADRNQIRESLKSFLTIRQTMTEMELLDAVLQICPHLLTEVSFLSWKGLRDSLEYYFRDVIEIQDSLIVSRS